MNSLKHITEEQLRRYYYIEGQISGLPQKVEPNYVSSCIQSYSTWNDEWNKSKFELYIKENLPKMEIQYDNIVKQKQNEQRIKEKVIDMLLHMDNSLYVKNIVLNKFKIPLEEYYHKLSPVLKSIYNFGHESISSRDLGHLVKLDKCGSITDIRIKNLSKEFKFDNISSVQSLKNMSPHQESINQVLNTNKIFEKNRIRIEELQKLTRQCHQEADKVYQNIQNKINNIN